MSLNKPHFPEIIVFAGPNGSGKSTISQLCKIIEPYINADEIKKTIQCSDLEAAQKATSLREAALVRGSDFTFETVLSTERNLELLTRGKAQGYFIRCIYVLTENPEINVARVKSRQNAGGHGVPEAKIRSRYDRALALIPRLVPICDILHIYDNSILPWRIFKKRKTEYFFWENDYWSKTKIEQLTGIAL